MVELVRDAVAVREEIVFSYIGLESRRHMFMIKARIGEEDVGYISVRKGDVTPSLTPAIPRSACYQVAGIEIDPKWRRRGIGTALYEEAARITAEAGYALCSDTVLSQEAEEFWVKQTRKGRAKWEIPGPPEHEDRAFQYGRYVLDYPPPSSLSGQDIGGRAMPELSQEAAERYIRVRLKDLKWSRDDIERIISLLLSLDGYWSYGTTRAIKDLEQINVEMMEDNVSEARAESYIRRELREQDWTPDTVEIVVDAMTILDGFTSDGTIRAISDLEKIYGEMVKKHGEPPDLNW